MKLIKEFTDILREIVSSGDEEQLRRLEEIIRAHTTPPEGMETRFLH